MHHTFRTIAVCVHVFFIEFRWCCDASSSSYSIQLLLLNGWVIRLPHTTIVFISYLHFISVWYQRKTITESKPRMVCLWPSSSLHSPYMGVNCTYVFYLYYSAYACMDAFTTQPYIRTAATTTIIATNSYKTRNKCSFPGTRLKFQSYKEIVVRCIINWQRYKNMYIRQTSNKQPKSNPRLSHVRWNDMTFSNIPKCL